MSDPIYNPTWPTIVNRALRIVGAYDASKQPRAEQVNSALETLCMMLKEWQVDNGLWLRTFATLFLNKGQTSYKLADLANGGNHCATSYIQTTASAAAAAGAGTVVLTSSAGMTTGDYLGVADANGLIEWFTATFTGNSAALSGTLSAAVSLGAVVYSHTTANQIYRPTRIFTAARKLYDPVAENGIEVEIELYSRAEYSYMPNKTVTGKIVQAYYDPQLAAGTLYVWPTADTPNDKLKLTVDRPILIPTSDTDTLDVPMELVDPITFCLAERLWWEYPGNGGDYQLIAQRAIMGKESVASYDREMAPTQFQRDWRS